MGSVILFSTLLSLCVLGRLVGRFAEVEVAKNLRQGRQAFEEFILLRKKLLRDKARLLSQTPYLKAALNIAQIDHETVSYSARKIVEATETPLFVVLDSQGALLSQGTEPDRHGEDMRPYPGVRASGPARAWRRVGLARGARTGTSLHGR